jgi:hypothetical protein
MQDRLIISSGTRLQEGTNSKGRYHQYRLLSAPPREARDPLYGPMASTLVVFAQDSSRHVPGVGLVGIGARIREVPPKPHIVCTENSSAVPRIGNASEFTQCTRRPLNHLKGLDAELTDLRAESYGRRDYGVVQ